MSRTSAAPSELTPPAAEVAAAPAAEAARWRWAAWLVLLSHLALVSYNCAIHSPGWDEVGHLPAGLAHWQSGVFDLYRVNPPLVRTWAALLPYLCGARLDFAGRKFTSGTLERAEFDVGNRWLETDVHGFLADLLAARLMCLAFAAAGAGLCWRWASAWYGPRAGCAALALWSFSPLILGHAAMITPDVGSASLGGWAVYLFWRWLTDPAWRTGANVRATWRRAVAAGVALGLALLTKFTLLALAPLFVGAFCLGVLCGWWRDRLQLRCVQFAGLAVLALYTINLGYGFEQTLRPLGEYRFGSHFLRAPDGDDLVLSNRFADTWLAAVPVPLPANYVRGIDNQKRDFDQKMMSYLRGEWRLGGWWYYYLYAAVIKEPIGNLVLLVLAAGALPTLSGQRRRDTLLFLVAPGLLLLALVSSQTGFNHHLRYLLPAYPFAYVFAAHVFGPHAQRRWRWWPACGGVCLVAGAASSLAHFPHSMSYFNELIGGPRQAPQHLHNSNLDWGQDLSLLVRWSQAHPAARPLCVVFSGGFDSEQYPGWGPDVEHRFINAQEADELRRGVRHGWYALSVGKIFDPPAEGDPYRLFRERPPDDMVGYSIYIYRF